MFVRCDDNEVYNVKFLQNPQTTSSGIPVLPNEVVATGLAALIGLPTPRIAIVEVGTTFLTGASGELLKLLQTNGVAPGLHFGSHRVGGVEDKANEMHLEQCVNPNDFPTFFAFDIWTDNADRKMDHCLICKPDFDHARIYVSSVDHGHCFGAKRWCDQALVANQNSWCKLHVQKMAHLIEGKDPFAKPLQKLDGVSDTDVQKILAYIPTEWNISGTESACLQSFITSRRGSVRSILSDNRALFPKWI